MKMKDPLDHLYKFLFMTRRLQRYMGFCPLVNDWHWAEFSEFDDFVAFHSEHEVTYGELVVGLTGGFTDE
jgi:hypothetical protein